MRKTTYDAAIIIVARNFFPERNFYCNNHPQIATQLALAHQAPEQYKPRGDFAGVKFNMRRIQDIEQRGQAENFVATECTVEVAHVGLDPAIERCSDQGRSVQVGTTGESKQ